jgi:hypothetical protein
VLLQKLAKGDSASEVQLKKNILKRLMVFTSDDADTSTTGATDQARESWSQFDCRDEMEALYEAFSKHKQCHDHVTDTTEPLITQMCLSEISRNNIMGLKISLLVLIHIHTKLRDARVIRLWRNVEIDVFHQR